MILLDASALVAFLLDEPAAGEVEAILRAGQAAVTSVGLAEALDVTVRVIGRELAEVESALLPLLRTSLGIVPVGEGEARKGATIRIVHYHREGRPLSMADCLLLGTALVHRASLATSDGALAQTARAENIELVPLPNSRGQRPTA